MDEQLGLKYAAAMRAGLRLYAAWPFGIELKIGDYGRLTGDLFVKQGHIHDLISTQLSTDAVPAAVEFNYSSEGVETFQPRATVAGAGAELSAKVTFEKTESIYFRSIKLQQEWLKGLHQVAAEIMKSFKEGKWDGQWVFIHSLFRSDGTTLLINRGDNAYIEFQGSSPSQGSSLLLMFLILRMPILV